MYYKNMMRLKEQYHPDCIFNSDLFNLNISFNKSGELIAHFDCNKKYQGYPGRIHGGILSGIMDSAMTQCLFGHNIIAYTIRLNIKYSHPVEINKEVIVKVRVQSKQNEPFYNLTGSISQDNKKLVTADAKFWLEKDLNKEDL